MSFAAVNEPRFEAPSAMPITEHTKPTYKSYRKKYLKSRHVFKEKMRDSNSLFEDEQRTAQIANRLQEQIDQFLDLLLDLNGSNHIPASLRYTLSPTPSPSAVPALEPDDPQSPSASRMNASTAASNLEEAHLMFSRGQISPARYQEIEAQLHPYIHNPTSIEDLFKQIPHTTLDSIPRDSSAIDLSSSENPTYLSSAHEDAYLNSLDAAISSSHIDQDVVTFPVVAPPKKDNLTLSVKDTHKDLSIRNPVSAYNWLRKHKPDLFATMQFSSDLGLSEERKPKPSPKPNTSHPSGTRGGGGGAAAAKRERASGINLKPEPERLDDEGNVIGGGLDGTAGGPGTGRGGKRKRGEDEPYRPKGGSSRTTKRKRAGTGGGKGARSSGGVGGGGADEGGMA
ncbi:MAG: hypothetical protein Q9219_005036 [cf. Caloplaca sp. 3 TL-2023]